jgi:hypothetical protein
MPGFIFNFQCQYNIPFFSFYQGQISSNKYAFFTVIAIRNTIDGRFIVRVRRSFITIKVINLIIEGVPYPR